MVCGKRAFGGVLVGIAGSHGWKTHFQAFVQHANVMIERIISGDLYLKLFR